MTHPPYLADVKTHDWDRFLAISTAAPERFEGLLAILAFHLEIAKIADVVSDPTVGMIRLQWWQEALDEIEQQPAQVRRHPVITALATLHQAAPLPLHYYRDMIAARQADFSVDGFADITALETYLEATSGGLLHMLLHYAAPASPLPKETITALGIAWGLLGTLRAAPALLPKAVNRIPAALLPAGITLDRYGSAAFADAIQQAAQQMLERSDAQLAVAQSALKMLPKSDRKAHALLRAMVVLSQFYLQQLRRINGNILRRPILAKPSLRCLLKLWVSAR